MSQAEALLNTVAEIPTHTHPVPDTDTYFIIDPITRTIENVTSKKTVIMQFDHNSERFTFEIPRYIDGHDMLNCTSITVNVDNIEEETGTTISDAPDMTDLRIHPNDPEKVISSWIITRNCTQLAGTLSFHIEYKCADSNGNVVYEWSTDTYDEIQIKARKKNGETAVIEHTDLLEQWRAQIFGAGDSVMSNITAEGGNQVAAIKAESITQQNAVGVKGVQTLETIPEDYTTVDAMADAAVRTKSDAIILESEGGFIALKDSSDDYIRGLKLFGKSSQMTTTGAQLIPFPYYSGSTTTNGVTFIVNEDGSITASGTSVAGGINYYFIRNHTLPMGTYTLSYSGDYIGAKLYLYDYTDKLVLAMVSETTKSVTFTTTKDYDNISVYFSTGEVGVVFKGTIYPMLNAGTSALPYEPYTGGKPSPSPDCPQKIISIEKPTACICGKNLVDSSAVVRTVQANVSTDSNKIYVKKTNTGDIYSNFYYRIGTWNELAGKTITVSIENTSDYVWHMHIGDLDNANAWVADNALKSRSVEGRAKTVLTATIPNNVHCSFVGLRFVSSDTSISDETYVLQNMQVEVGDIATEYEPYRPIQSLATNHTICGIPVTSGGNYTDENGQQWICDEVDLERGVHIQRLGRLVLNGSDAWHIYNYETQYYGFHIWDILDGNYFRAPGLCNQFKTVGASNKECLWVGVSNGNIYAISKEWYDKGLDAWKAHLNEQPLDIVYALNTPIETPLTAEEIVAFKSLKTNCPNTTVLNDAGAWMTVKYNADTKTYIDNPKTLKLVDSATGVLYELKIVNGTITATPI